LGIYDPIYQLAGYNPVVAGQVYFSGALDSANTWTGTAELLGTSAIGLAVVNAYGAFWFMAKAMTVIFIQIWIRWTLPRIRIDQVLHACVKVLLPASLVTLAGVAFWRLVVPQPGAAQPMLPDATGQYVAMGDAI